MYMRRMPQIGSGRGLQPLFWRHVPAIHRSPSSRWAVAAERSSGLSGRPFKAPTRWPGQRFSMCTEGGSLAKELRGTGCQNCLPSDRLPYEADLEKDDSANVSVVALVQH